MVRMSLQHTTWTALVLLATLHTLIPLSQCSDPPIDLAFDASPVLTGGEGEPCMSSADCEYPFMCCGCSRYAGARRGRCLLPHHDQCNWEMGCLTDDDSCGCAWSKCQPYHSLPCHNARRSYECKPYDVSEHMQRCGY